MLTLSRPGEGDSPPPPPHLLFLWFFLLMDKDNDAKIDNFLSNFITDMLKCIWRQCHLKCCHVNLKLRSQFSNFCIINSMTEVFLPIFWVILSTTTTTKIWGFYFVTRATKLLQRFKSFLRRQNVIISFKQTNIWLNILIFCLFRTDNLNKHFNDLWKVNCIFINSKWRLLVKVNGVRSGFFFVS